MPTFYHTLTMALANVHGLYKRDCKILDNRKVLPLRKFQAQGLILGFLRGEGQT
jgi:hypothetical protein